MKNFLVKLIALISLISGGSALVKFVKYLYTCNIASLLNNSNEIIMAIAFMVYVLLVIGGLMILANNKIGFIMVITAYLFQVPYIYTKELLYDLTAGFSSWIYVVNSSLVEFKNIYGSYFTYNTNINAYEDIVGFNIFAIVVIIILFAGLKSTKIKTFVDKKRNYKDKNDRKQVIYGSREFIK